jgi:hypothetical protein
MLPAQPVSVLHILRRQAVALFVTFHIVCVIIIALPSPPATSDDILEHPEVKAEMQAAIDVFGKDFVEQVLQFVRAYTRWTNSAKSRVNPYLEIAGSTQSWHMFGGTPPRFPLVFVVEVKPKGEKSYVLYQDLQWGTRDSAAMNFRHRKVHEALCAWEGDFMWDQYARYWADRWDVEHPERPVQSVRLSATQWTTPLPEDVRAGNADRKPKTGLEVHVWSRR